MKDFTGKEIQPGDFVAYVNPAGGWGDGFQTGFILRVNKKTAAVIPLYKVGKKRNPKNKRHKAHLWNKAKYPREMIKIPLSAAPQEVINKFDQAQFIKFLQFAKDLNQRENNESAKFVQTNKEN